MGAVPPGHVEGASNPDESFDLRIPEALDGVIVDDAPRLHERIADGGADEPEAAPGQVLAHGVERGGSGRELFQRSPRISLWSAPDEPPDIGVEAAELFLDGR